MKVHVMSSNEDMMNDADESGRTQDHRKNVPNGKGNADDIKGSKNGRDDIND